MLFLVHRNELATQAAEKLHKYNPALSVGIEKSEQRAGNADLLVASVQTIGQTNGNRISQFNPDDFAIIQMDEAHHASHKAQQWLGVLRYFRVLKGEPDEDKGRVLIGWTATPNRGDNEGLEIAFSQIVHSYDIRTAVKDGWLAPIVAWRIESEIDLSHVKTEMGDFCVPDLASAVNTPERNELIARKYEEICPGKPAIFFTCNVAHSVDLATTLRDHHFKVYPISGKTPDDERKRFLRMFQSGEIQGLTSCAVLSEGVDLPAAEVGVMARPTKSGLLFRQQIGRILRPYPSPEDLAEMARRGMEPAYIKQNALILDVCDVSGRHSLISSPTLFGLRRDYNAKGKPLIEQVEEIEALEAEHPGLDLRSAPNLDAIKTSLHRLDLLAVPTIPEEIRKISRFVWTKESPGAYHLGVLDGSLISVRENTLGDYEIYRHIRGIRTKLWVAKGLREAIAKAEDEIPNRDQKVMMADASWRREPCTEKQAARLFMLDHKLRKEFHNPVDLFTFCVSRYNSGDGAFSRGSVSNRISSLTAARS
jgi:superfamily II DNA or RNA helicase